MAVWFSAGCVPALRDPPCFTLKCPRHQTSENATNDCRNNVLRTRGRAYALNHGGTIA